MKKYIGFFGLRNAGKSSLVNAIANQQAAIVSPVAGTTTDPVFKSMELLPAGPVVLMDTPGIDDTGELGTCRAERAIEMLDRTDFAVLAIEAGRRYHPLEKQLLQRFAEKNIPYLIVRTKSDLLPRLQRQTKECEQIYLSIQDAQGLERFKRELAKHVNETEKEKSLLPTELVKEGDTVILVMPIDEAAPKGRLILPQQQTIRALLERQAVSVCVREEQLTETLKKTHPKLVITDSQIFGRVSREVPKDIMLTSFSILFAAYKGDLWKNVQGADALDDLKVGDEILISEGCTHHRQCGDIGTVKLPHWISEYTGKKLHFTFTSGKDFDKHPERYACVIHCGACMLSEREVLSRYTLAWEKQIPMTNYGIAIAKMNGILERSIQPLKGENQT